MKPTILTLFISLLAPFAALAVSDADVMGLKGNVRSLTTITAFNGFETEQKIDFDAKGNITAIDGNAVAITRDDSGRMTLVILQDEDEEGTPAEFRITLSYPSAAATRPSSAAYDSIWDSWTESFTYDSKGLTLKRAVVDPVEPSSISYSYTDSDFDSNGNWTGRTATSSDAGTNTENRIITYY